MRRCRCPCCFGAPPPSWWTKLLTEVAVTVFKFLGLHVSFDNGKTEAVAYCTGAGSKAAQRALAEKGSCSLFSFLGVQYMLKFVKSYKHLGSHFSVSNELRLEIVSKAGYIQSGIGAIPPILKHPKVELKKKMSMVKSHLLGGGLHQCGTWGYIPPNVYGRLLPSIMYAYRIATHNKFDADRIDSMFSDADLIQEYSLVSSCMIRACRLTLFARLILKAPMHIQDIIRIMYQYFLQQHQLSPTHSRLPT